MATALSDKQPTARKPYTCNTCYSRIPIGTKYRRVAMVDYGDFWEWIECLACAPLYALVQTYLDGCWHEELQEDDFTQWARENAETDPQAQAFLDRRFSKAAS